MAINILFTLHEGVEPTSDTILGDRIYLYANGTYKMVEPKGIEPLTLCVQSRCSPS